MANSNIELAVGRTCFSLLLASLELTSAFHWTERQNVQNFGVDLVLIDEFAFAAFWLGGLAFGVLCGKVGVVVFSLYLLAALFAPQCLTAVVALWNSLFLTFGIICQR